VPHRVTDEQAVFVEPLAAAAGITERIDPASASRLAVIGDGKLGLLCAQALRAKGIDVSLIGKHDNKLQVAARRDIETFKAEDAARLNGAFDVVVEASGAESGFAMALDLLHPRGTLVLKSTFQGKTPIDAARIVVNEISVVGSRCGRFAPALELLKEGAVDVESLISEEFPLADGVNAMQRAAERGVMKVLLRP
jgi:threonine dehydrogenase-like Zn-dependent dehydrogenase